MRSLNEHINKITSTNTSLEENWLSELEQFDKLQLTFSNTSKQDQLAKIWGANQGIELFQQEQSFKTDNYPQVIAKNPTNGLWYVVNQLAASIEIFEPSGELVNKVQIEQEYIGFASLVDISFDSSTGTTFVIGAISNKLYIIDSNHELVNSVPVVNRPISVEFNDFTKMVQIAHLTENTVSIVDPTSENISLIEVDNISIDIAINHETGAWISLEQSGQNLCLYDRTNQSLGKVENIGKELRKVIFLANENAIVLAAKSKEVSLIDLQNLSINNAIQFDGTPVDLQLSGSDNLLVLTTNPNQIAIYDLDLNLIKVLDSNFVNAGVAISEDDGNLLIPNPTTNTVAIMAINGASMPIVPSENYLEVLRDFQHKPVLIKHLKIHFSGRPTAPFIRIGRKSSSGKTISRLVSMEKYRSPQHFAPIFNLMEFENEIIDGRTYWEVLIPPEQSITLMLYYSQ